MASAFLLCVLLTFPRGSASDPGAAAVDPGPASGALTVAVVQNILNLRAVPAAWQNITLGGIIVLAVAIDMWRNDIARLVGKLFGRGRRPERVERPMTPQPPGGE